MSEEQKFNFAQIIPIDDIFIDDEFNCRGSMAPIDVEELAKDIQKDGLLQPVLIMNHNEEEVTKTGKKYKLVAGFRRTYAHKILKLKEILAVVKPHMDNIKARVMNLSENLKRKDLNILQEAKAIEALYKAGVPRDSVARLLGVSPNWVQVRFGLLNMPDDIQKEAAAGLLNQYEIKKISTMPVTQMYELVRKIKDNKLKGEKIDIVRRQKLKPDVKKHRKKEEIQEMMDFIRDQIGGSAFTIGMAWAAGNINDIELYEAIEKYAKERNLVFDRHREPTAKSHEPVYS